MFGISEVNAQTVEITGSCSSAADGTYTQAADVNGRPSFVLNTATIQWSGTRWEHTSGSAIGMFNTADTPNPPASSLQAWTAGVCNPTGTFSGSGTCCTLACATLCPTGGGADVPTLSEWGLIVLALLLLTLGTLYLVQPSVRESFERE